MGKEEAMTSDIVLAVLIIMIGIACMYFWTVNKLLKRTTINNQTMNIKEHKEFRYDIDIADGKIARLTGRIEVMEHEAR
jgi:hypothetical protein